MYNFLFPCPTDATNQILFGLALKFLRRCSQTPTHTTSVTSGMSNKYCTFKLWFKAHILILLKLLEKVQKCKHIEPVASGNIDNNEHSIHEISKQHIILFVWQEWETIYYPIIKVEILVMIKFWHLPVIIARIFSLVKSRTTNNISCLDIMCFRIWYLKIDKIKCR